MNLSQLKASFSEKVEKCPVCKSDALGQYFSGDRHFLDLSHLRCRECGHVVQNKLPTPDALNDFYRNWYRKLYKKSDSVSMDEILTQQKFERGFASGLFIAKHLGSNHIETHLDIGASDGFAAAGMSRAIKAENTFSVELDTVSAEIATEYFGIKQFKDTQEALNAVKPDSKLLISMNHVLEHFIDPASPIAIQSQLPKEVWLYLDVPDVKQYTHYGDFHIAHIHHFAPSSVTRLLESAGWQPVVVESYKPLNQPPSIRALARRLDKGKIIELSSFGSNIEKPSLNLARVKYLVRKFI